MEQDKVRIKKSIPLREEDKINYFAKLPKDIIIYIALLLDKPDIMSYCNISEKFNNAVCQNKQFWVKKLKRDFNTDYYKTNKLTSPRGYYDIGILKNKWNLGGTIEQIYQMEKIAMDKKKIKEIP